jgi:putative tryptophan/tyrosine transport system substrate-binding protein
VLVQGSPQLNRDRRRIIALAAKHQLPAIYEWRHHVEEDGGLMAYGSNMWTGSLRVKPADLPIEQPTKFELVIKLRRRRPLG